MTGVEGKKRPIGLLVLTLICLFCGGVSLIWNIDLLIDGKGFLSLITSVISLVSFFIMFLYCIKDTYRNKRMILFFIILRIFLCFVDLCFTIRVIIIADLNLDLANIISNTVSFWCWFIPLVFMLLNLTKNKKTIECITLFFLVCLILIYLVSIINLHSFFDYYNSGTDLILGPLANNAYNFLLFWLWFTQIAQHITFKEKIKFDFKPIQKKVAVTETTLEELKLMYDNGTISENEYNRRKAEIISKL